mmetsp:Transcript_10925/g.16499  ORF Transcript_10925/g.16499 Transcript_10925/m.16499 type:complete len:213 (+) Transcript_10925:543-1181(+)
MSFEATMLNFSNEAILNCAAIFLKYARDSFDRKAKSPLSSRIPIGLYPKSCNAKLTAMKFGTPLFNVSYVSTNAKNPVGKANAYAINAANSPRLVLLPCSSCERYSSTVSINVVFFSLAPLIGGILMSSLLSASMPVNDDTNECACVPLIGMSLMMPANTFEVPSNPPMYAYFEADMAPSGPCARRSPNSSKALDVPTHCRMRHALVVTNEA